mmetsp:Transcript_58266/g.126659  ORF Transcript_58266/g.126659 Transcript_58266/m.126659 type:complete len:219 (+) Transcript_58266:538-1194(+)
MRQHLQKLLDGDVGRRRGLSRCSVSSSNGELEPFAKHEVVSAQDVNDLDGAHRVLELIRSCSSRMRHNVFLEKLQNLGADAAGARVLCDGEAHNGGDKLHETHRPVGCSLSRFRLQLLGCVEDRVHFRHAMSVAMAVLGESTKFGHLHGLERRRVVGNTTVSLVRFADDQSMLRQRLDDLYLSLHALLLYLVVCSRRQQIIHIHRWVVVCLEISQPLL